MTATLKTSKTTPPRDLLAKNVIALRRERGWSQEDLALNAGFHRTFVTKVETRARNVTLDNIGRLADTLGVPVVRLFEDD